ncbi:hypothetical protein EYC80_001487 [Monilinia laxa]|uniref:Uncharacterized protein n=1 Tax=Monilinia laxa TaxID=61186 RepID=A0A5N6K530_MONLA|nr:hypothetical protein EYC80_001487 [Monilinia laxa]
MSLDQENTLGNPGFGSGNPTNQVLQSTLEKIQQDIKQQSLRLRRQDRQLEQQKKQLQQQEKQIQILNKNTQRWQQEHHNQIQFRESHAQQFTMHIQSHQLRIQQLFAMQTGGSEMHAYGPPPLPDMIPYRPSPPRDLSQYSVALSRRKRNQTRRAERDRSRSPDRNGRRYLYNRREDRSHASGTSSLPGLGMVSREPGSMGGMGAVMDGGDGNSLSYIPFRLKDNPGLEEGEAQEFVKKELAEDEVKREMDG